jgi:hypothetical protein
MVRATELPKHKITRRLIKVFSEPLPARPSDRGYEPSMVRVQLWPDDQKRPAAHPASGEPRDRATTAASRGPGRYSNRRSCCPGRSRRKRRRMDRALALIRAALRPLHPRRDCGRGRPPFLGSGGRTRPSKRRQQARSACPTRRGRNPLLRPPYSRTGTSAGPSVVRARAVPELETQLSAVLGED